MKPEPKPLRLEASGNVVVAVSPGGALAEVGNLPDFFRRHIAGEIKITNLHRPDLAAVFNTWKLRH
jgi:hypothetical protein